MSTDLAFAGGLGPFGRTITAAPELAEREVGHGEEEFMVGDEGGERRHC